MVKGEPINQVISFSGGRTSAYLVWLMLKINPNSVIVFMDTGAEHPATYQFVREVADRWGVNIVCLRAIPAAMGKGMRYQQVSISEIGPDLEPFRLMVNKYGHPYVGGAFCTDRMKTRPFQKYCNDLFGKGNYVTWLGIRADEPKRLKPKPGIKFLADISDFDKADVLSWWRDRDFDLKIPEHLGNCVFCIKKSLMKVALAAKDEPQLARQFMEMIDENDIKKDRQMYRGKSSLGQVIAMFESNDREELASRIKSMKKYDSGSCSESCEAFNFDKED